MHKLQKLVAVSLAVACAVLFGASQARAQEAGATISPATQERAGRVPEWTANARWYYITIPRFRNGDKANDPENTLPWTTIWPPVETEESAPREKTGEFLLPLSRRYGGDLRGVIESIPYLKKLGVNAICVSPVFHGGLENKLDQVDLRHVDDSIGVKGGLGQANSEGSLPESWVWTSSDKVLRELIQTAHEMGMRVVIGGIFHAVMATRTLPSEMESYYLAATRRWMDPDGDGRPQDGVDGWILAIEERGLRAFDDNYKAFWRRWREAVRKINPDAVVISSGTLALGQLSGEPFDIALHTSMGAPMGEFFGIQKERKSQVQSLFDSLDSSAAISPADAVMSNIALVSGGYQNSRLLTAVAATEPIRKGKQPSEGPVPDDAARMRWKLATIVQHFLPGAPVTWFGDEVGMFGGPSHFCDAPMWWSDGAGSAAKPEHFQPEFYSLIQWLHKMREDYPVLRLGALRRVLADDANKVLAFSRHMPGEEIVLVVNYGDTKQLVMLPAGKPGQIAGVRAPTLETVRPPKEPESDKPPAPDNQSNSGTEFPHLPIIAARQVVNEEGKIGIWLDPMSVRVVFFGESP